MNSPRRFGFLRFIDAYPYGALLVANAVMLVGAPMTSRFVHDSSTISGAAGLTPLTLLLTVASAFAVARVSHRTSRLIIWLGFVLVALGLCSILVHRGFLAASLAGQTIFLGLVTWSILRSIFAAEVVDGNILCGAANVYLLTGVLFGYLFAVIDLGAPGSFTIAEPTVIPPHDSLSSDPGLLIYYSFTTLTTVGLGDILPSRPLARSLSVVEAVAGQIMVVVIIARLVGLHVAQASNRSGAVAFTREDDSKK